MESRQTKSVTVLLFQHVAVQPHRDRRKLLHVSSGRATRFKIITVTPLAL